MPSPTNATTNLIADFELINRQNEMLQKQAKQRRNERKKAAVRAEVEIRDAHNSERRVENQKELKSNETHEQKEAAKAKKAEIKDAEQKLEKNPELNKSAAKKLAQEAAKKSAANKAAKSSKRGEEVHKAGSTLTGKKSLPGSLKRVNFTIHPEHQEVLDAILNKDMGNVDLKELQEALEANLPLFDESFEMPAALKGQGLEGFLELLKSGNGKLIPDAELKQLIANSLLNLKEIKQKAAAENWAELDFDFANPGKSMIDELFKPENLKGVKATPEEILEAKIAAKQFAKQARGLLDTMLPAIMDSLEDGLLSEFGIDLNNPEVNPNALDENGELINPEKSTGEILSAQQFFNKFADPSKTNTPFTQDVNQAIFAAISKSIDINQLLQQLGVRSDFITGGVQKRVGEKLVEDSKKTFQSNKKARAKAHKSKCLQKVVRILGDVVGALFIISGNWTLGAVIILASEGLIKEMIQKLAKAIGVPEALIDQIIMLLTAIAASPILLAPGGGYAAYFGILLAVAGMIGYFENTIGYIATGSDKAEDYPEWVTWTALGIELGLSLILVFESIYTATRAITQGAGQAAGNVLRTAAVEGEQATAQTARAGARAAAATDAAVDGAAGGARVAEAAAAQANQAAWLQRQLEAIREFLTRLGARLENFSKNIGEGIQATLERVVAKEAAEKIIRYTQKAAEWTRMLAQGSQTGVQFEMAKNQFEIAEVVKEAAKLLGETHMMQSFLNIYAQTLKGLRSRNKEYAMDSTEDIARLAAIIKEQSRANKIVSSA